MRRSVSRFAGGGGASDHGPWHLPLRPEVGSRARGASRRRRVDLDVFGRPYSTFAAALEPEPEPEPDVPPTSSLWSGPKTPRDGYLSSASSVSAAGNPHVGTLAATAVDKLEPGATPPLRWITTGGSKTPCDGYLSSASCVPAAGHHGEGSAAALTGSLAATAFNKLAAFVGYGQTTYQDGGQMCCPDVRMGSSSHLLPLGPKRCYVAALNRFNRLYSTVEHCQLPQIEEVSLDLMTPPQQRQSATAIFDIVVDAEGHKSFMEALDMDIISCKRCLEIDCLKKEFHTLVPALKVRGLLSPFSFQDKEGRGLHWAFKNVVDKVMYLSSYDLAKSVVCMPFGIRCCFLDYLCDEHVIVTPDWESLGTSITQVLYDHGLKCPPKTREMCKGECDGSYDTDKKYAKIGIILWKENQVLWSEVIDKVPCGSSVEAEALAMCLLLKRSVQLLITSLEVCTDCDMIDRVVRGEQLFGDSHELVHLFNLLRLMRSRFDNLVCRWVPRECLSFVDGLLRNDDVFTRTDLDRSTVNKTEVSKILRKWEPYLNGDTFFSIKERKAALRNKVTKKLQSEDELLKTHNVCYCLTSEKDEDKLNAFFYICRALTPITVQINMSSNSKTNGRIGRLLKKIRAMFGHGKIKKVVTQEKVCRVYMSLDEEVEREIDVRRRTRKTLKVIVDPKDLELFEEQDQQDSVFTVLLASSQDKESIQTTEEFSPCSLASFEGLYFNKKKNLQDFL